MFSYAKQRQRKVRLQYLALRALVHLKQYEGCGVEVKVEMWKLYTITVIYSRSVKHMIGEQHHRRITGEKREEMEKNMYGSKPLPQFLKEHEKLTPQSVNLWSFLKL